MDPEAGGGSPSFHDVRGALAQDLVQVSETAALAAGRLMGRADAERVKQAAGSAMLNELEGQGFHGKVVLGPRGGRSTSTTA